MPRMMLANQATATKRRIFFHCVDATDGITAEVGEAGGQPEISTNGAGWTSAGAVIGVLVSIGNGRYYAELSQAAVATAGTLIESRYKSANTAESIGDSIQVVAFDPDSATSLGLTNLDAAISSRAAAATALSTVDWTGPRATSLDNLDALVSSRLATAGYTAPDNTTIGTIDTKLGTPVTSVSADIAAVKVDTAANRIFLQKVVGLLYLNSVMDQQVFNGSGSLTSARIRVYDTAANAQAAGLVGLLYTFTVGAVYDISNVLTSYTILE